MGGVQCVQVFGDGQCGTPIDDLWQTVVAGGKEKFLAAIVNTIVLFI